MRMLFLTALVAVGCSQKPTLRGVDALATQAPAGCHFFLGFDARDKMPKDLVKNLDKYKGDPRLAPALKNLNEQSGLDAVQFVKGFEPAGWAIVWDPAGRQKRDDLVLVGGIWVRDRKQAEASLAQATQGEKATLSTAEGKSISQYKSGYTTCFSGPFLLFCNRPGGIEALLKYRGPSLAEEAGFQSAHRQLLQNQSLAFFYSSLRPTLELAAGKSSQPAQQAGRGLRYLAGGVSGQSPYRCLATLALDPKSDSALIQGLLKAPATSNRLGDRVPASWNLYLMTQLRYPLEALTTVAGWSPNGKKGLGEVSTGLKEVGIESEAVNRALEGDMALALDLKDYFAKIPEHPPTGLLQLGVRNPAEFEKLWKSLVRLGGIATKSQKWGAYQLDTFADVPFLLLARNKQRALLLMGPSPLELLKTLEALKPEDSMMKHAAFESLLRGGGLFAVRYELDKVARQLAQLGLLRMSPQLAPLQFAVEHYSPEMWQGQMTVQVQPEGIVAEGSPLTMLIGGAVNGAFLAAFLEG